MTNQKIKLIALDIDGTIMNKQFSISEKVKKTIKEALVQNVHVVIATGRTYSATVPIASELGIKTPLIVYQGSLIQEFYNSKKVLVHHTVDPDTSYRLIKDLRKYEIQINAYIKDKLCVEKSSAILDEYAVKRNVPIHHYETLDEIKGMAPTKIMAIDYDTDLITQIKHDLLLKYKNNLNITKSTEHFCEFVNNNCSKGASLSFLADKFGINSSEIMAIGDQDNDKEMIKFAGLGVAMGNGDAELKKTADFITDSVDNDGVALAIEKFVIN